MTLRFRAVEGHFCPDPRIGAGATPRYLGRIASKPGAPSETNYPRDPDGVEVDVETESGRALRLHCLRLVQKGELERLDSNSTKGAEKPFVKTTPSLGGSTRADFIPGHAIRDNDRGEVA